MLLEKIKEYNIYLASQSPRRQQLLRDLGIDFLIARKINIEETYSPFYKKEEIPLFLSQIKANAYSYILSEPNRIVIAADTIVWQKNKVLGKPKDKQEAIIMLKRLSNSKHTVITGITLSSMNKSESFFCSTEVFFKELSFEEIQYYVNNFKPYDKAGAYGIQEWIGFVGVEKIEGSYFNVVGLPIHKLYKELEKFIIS